jgi:plasmid stabilization system protein ParE
MKLVWSKTSEQTLGEILNYIESKFGNIVADNYYYDVMQTVEGIENHPEMFPIYQNNTETRKAVINKKTILYYKIGENYIFLLAFYDTRMGTHKL